MFLNRQLLYSITSTTLLVYLEIIVFSTDFFSPITREFFSNDQKSSDTRHRFLEGIMSQILGSYTEKYCGDI